MDEVSLDAGSIIEIPPEERTAAQQIQYVIDELNGRLVSYQNPNSLEYQGLASYGPAEHQRQIDLVKEEIEALEGLDTSTAIKEDISVISEHYKELKSSKK